MTRGRSRGQRQRWRGSGRSCGAAGAQLSSAAAATRPPKVARGGRGPVSNPCFRFHPFATLRRAENSRTGDQGAAPSLDGVFLAPGPSPARSRIPAASVAHRRGAGIVVVPNNTDCWRERARHGPIPSGRPSAPPTSLRAILERAATALRRRERSVSVFSGPTTRRARSRRARRCAVSHS